MTQSMLEIRNLKKKYKNSERTILNNINLSIDEEDFLCVLGPSGCGKSTMIRCIAGFEDYDGSVTVSGESVVKPGPDRIMVFQDFNQLFPWKTVEGYPDQLSGGMMQRAALARALACDASYLLMDEPFAALDAMTRKQLQKELIKIKEKEKMTVLFITHNIQEAISLGNRIMVMSKDGVIKELMDNPIKKPVTPVSEGYGELWEHLNNLLTQ